MARAKPRGRQITQFFNQDAVGKKIAGIQWGLNGRDVTITLSNGNYIWLLADGGQIEYCVTKHEIEKLEKADRFKKYLELKREFAER